MHFDKYNAGKTTVCQEMSVMPKEIKYIDVHGHLNLSDYDGDREEAIKRAQDIGVAMITVGTDLESSKKALELAEAHENMWATVGIHPTEIDVGHAITRGGVGTSSSGLAERAICPRDEGTDSYALCQDLAELASNPKVVAIGECGLDYFHSGPEYHERQKEMFARHIELANKVNKPLVLHIRNGKRDKKGEAGVNAYQEALETLKKHAKVRANFHFFAGTIQDLKNILNINGMVSFTGVITFTHDYDELVKYAPLDRIMSETDCPFVATAPHRGKRNEPAHVTEVVKAIAMIRGEEEQKVARQLLNNVRKFLSLNF